VLCEHRRKLVERFTRGGPALLIAVVGADIGETILAKRDHPATRSPTATHALTDGHDLSRAVAPLEPHSSVCVKRVLIFCRAEWEPSRHIRKTRKFPPPRLSNPARPAAFTPGHPEELPSPILRCLSRRRSEKGFWISYRPRPIACDHGHPGPASSERCDDKYLSKSNLIF
jgi:hypothetical protein